MARKKITDAHHESQKQPQQDSMDLPTTAVDSDASVKLEALRSLNQRLLNQELSRRQQIESLLQTKASLEEELRLAKSQAEGYNSELVNLGDEFVGLDVEKTVFDAFVSAQIALQASLMETRVKILESEAKELQKVYDDKENDIAKLREKLSEIEESLRNEKGIVAVLIAERDKLVTTLVSKTEEIENLRGSLLPLEGRNMEILRDIERLNLAHDTAVRLKEEGDISIVSLTRERDALGESLGEAGKLIEELKEEISRAFQERKRIEEIKDMEMSKAQALETSVGELMNVEAELRKQESLLLCSVTELEKRCCETDVKLREMEGKIDELGEEKRLLEEKCKQLSEAKFATELDLGKAMEALVLEKSKVDELVHEKSALLLENGRLDSEVGKLSSQEGELKALVSELLALNEANGEKNEGLELLIEDYKWKLEELKLEKNAMESSIDRERVNAMEMKKIIGELEGELERTLVAAGEAKGVTDAIFAENEELKMQAETLKAKLSWLEKMVSVAEKEAESMNGKAEMADARAEEILRILKQTAVFCKKEGSGSAEADADAIFEMKSEEAKQFLVEIEGIMEAFRNEETKVEKMQQQLESIKKCAEETRRKKGQVWAVFSSATSLLAAGTLAYAARRFAF